MRRVAVIGCGGAGKTTLARELGRRLDLPVLHVDGHYWRGAGARRGDDWAEIHGQLIAGDRWILDGMKPGLLAERLARADTAVFLDLPRRTCLRGVVSRRLKPSRPGPLRHWHLRPAGAALPALDLAVRAR